MSDTVHTACIIDDDQTFVFLVERIIARNNLCKKLLIYENGRVACEGLKALIERKADLPDIILLDINMPEMDGWAFLDEFVHFKPYVGKKITIYMVSSSVDEEDIQRASTYEDVSDYKVKPIDLSTLQELFRATP